MRWAVVTVAHGKGHTQKLVPEKAWGWDVGTVTKHSRRIENLRYPCNKSTQTPDTLFLPSFQHGDIEGKSRIQGEKEGLEYPPVEH